MKPLPHAIAAAVLLALPTTSSAQPSAEVGTILIAHGGGPAWDAHVEAIARLASTGGPIEVSFLMGPGAERSRFQDVAACLAAQGVTRIVVVPLLVSSHSGHYEQIRWLAGATEELDPTMQHHLHMSGLERAAVPVPMRVTPALDDAPEAARVLAERARTLAQDPPRQALFLIGHGPNSAEENAAWMRNLRVVADSVQAATGFRFVRVGLVRDDAPPEVRAEAVREIRQTIELEHHATGRPVVVVPVLISSGDVSRRKLPADLTGLPVVYDGAPLLPHAAIARWVEGRVRAALAKP